MARIPDKLKERFKAAGLWVEFSEFRAKLQDEGCQPLDAYRKAVVHYAERLGGVSEGDLFTTWGKDAVKRPTALTKAGGRGLALVTGQDPDTPLVKEPPKPKPPKPKPPPKTRRPRKPRKPRVKRTPKPKAVPAPTPVPAPKAKPVKKSGGGAQRKESAVEELRKDIVTPKVRYEDRRQVSARAVVEWVFENIDAEGVEEADAPSSGAYSYLKRVQNMEIPIEKFYDTWAKLLPTRQQLEQQDQLRDDGSTTQELIRGLLAKTANVGDRGAELATGA